MTAELEGGTFCLGAAGYIGIAATDLNGLQCAGLGLTVMVGTAVDGTLDTGIGFFGVHGKLPPVR